MSDDRVSVVFMKPWQGYNSGELAGFGPDRAKWLIVNKYARPFAARVTVTKDAEAVEVEVEEKKTPARKKTSKKSSKK